MKKTLLASLITVITPAAAWAGEWGIGPAVATYQPPQAGLEREVLGVPYITYQGEHLGIDLGTVTWSLHDSPAFTMALQGEVRVDGYEPGDSDALAGMAERKPSFDAGMGFNHSAAWGVLDLVLLTDITGTHDGFEARATYQHPFMIDRWLLAPAIGMKWQDASLVDYYYGVRADEAGVGRPAYAGDDAANFFAEMSVGYVFSERIDIMVTLEAIRFDDSISNSPVVDRRNQTSIITALLYKF